MLRAPANLRMEATKESFATVRREDFLGPAPWKIGSAQPLDPVVPYRSTDNTFSRGSGLPSLPL
jgi:hypothetical protein